MLIYFIYKGGRKVKKQETTVELNIIAKAERALSTVGALKKDMADLWGKDSIPRSYLSSFEKLENKVLSLKNLSKDGIIDADGLRQAKDASISLDKEIRTLTSSIEGMSNAQKFALLSDDVQKSLKARENAVNDYNAALEKSKNILKERAELEKKIESLNTQKKEKQSPVLSEKASKAQRYNELQKGLKQADTAIKGFQAKGASDKEGTAFAKAKERRTELIKEIEQLGFDETGLKEAQQELADYNVSVQVAKQEITELNKKIASLTVQLNGLVAETPEQSFDNLINALKELGVEGLDSAKSLDDVKKVLAGLEKKAFEPVAKSAASLAKKLDGLDKENKDIKNSVEASTEALKAQNEALARKEDIEARIKSFLGLKGVTKVLHNALRDAMQTITELDATMTEMSVVTDLTVGDYWDQLPEYSKRASELGVSINDAYEAATLYYQQGLRSNQVSAISAETLKMARIAGLDDCLCSVAIEEDSK